MLFCVQRIIFFSACHFSHDRNVTLPSFFFATTIMAATTVWQPRDDGLAEIFTLLEQQISPSSAVDKSQIWKQLEHFSQFPDFNNYLVFILVRAEVSLLSLSSLSVIDSIYLSPDDWSLKFGSLNLFVAHSSYLILLFHWIALVSSDQNF